MENRRRRVSSDLGATNVAGSKRNELVIDDFNGIDFNDPNQRLKAAELNEDSEELRQRVNKERVKEEPVNKEIKSRFDILLGIARATKDVEVDGVVFCLRTLKSYEGIDAYSAAVGAANGFEEMGKIRSRTLAYAIYSIDGVESDRAFQTQSISKKTEIIDNMSEVVVSHLFKEYNDLKNGVTSSFSKDVEVEGTEEIKK